MYPTCVSSELCEFIDNSCHDKLKKKINLQSLEDTQVGYISQKYTLDNYTLEKYTLAQKSLVMVATSLVMVATSLVMVATSLMMVAKWQGRIERLVESNCQIKTGPTIGTATTNWFLFQIWILSHLQGI